MERPERYESQHLKVNSSKAAPGAYFLKQPHWKGEAVSGYYSKQFQPLTPMVAVPVSKWDSSWKLGSAHHFYSIAEIFFKRRNIQTACISYDL